MRLGMKLYGYSFYKVPLSGILLLLFLSAFHFNSGAQTLVGLSIGSDLSMSPGIPCRGSGCPGNPPFTFEWYYSLNFEPMQYRGDDTCIEIPTDDIGILYVSTIVTSDDDQTITSWQFIEIESCALNMPELPIHNCVESINVYPNPATSEIQIIATNDIDPLSNVTITIQNLEGKYLYNSYFQMLPYNHTINISGFAQGAYVLQIYQGDNLSYTTKILKQ